MTCIIWDRMVKQVCSIKLRHRVLVSRLNQKLRHDIFFQNLDHHRYIFVLICGSEYILCLLSYADEKNHNRWEAKEVTRSCAKHGQGVLLIFGSTKYFLFIFILTSLIKKNIMRNAFRVFRGRGSVIKFFFYKFKPEVNVNFEFINSGFYKRQLTGFRINYVYIFSRFPYKNTEVLYQRYWVLLNPLLQLQLRHSYKQGVKLTFNSIIWYIFEIMSIAVYEVLHILQIFAWNKEKQQ